MLVISLDLGLPANDVMQPADLRKMVTDLTGEKIGYLLYISGEEKPIVWADSLLSIISYIKASNLPTEEYELHTHSAAGVVRQTGAELEAQLQVVTPFRQKP